MDKLLEIVKNVMQLIFPPNGVNYGIDTINHVFVIIATVVVVSMPIFLICVLAWRIMRGKKHG